ncbi:phage major capsid protein [Streptomyces antimicrobicus]|uniref:Phage major capsid protein n=1 Tax=Streptomyces antimicrobicus TaxID=2883108 RepID=A0ABS8B4G8_9ACTN|nr:phage major capsid protein [Streptomyces antimicrobicus]MCB5179501.1 phage major capsid protein [Streptomyces antimicrobicus]
MHFAAAAKAALEKRAGLINELRSVEADTTLSEAEKRERVERIDVDVRALEAEARESVERAEREAEVRSLAERAGGLVLPGPSGFRAGERDEAAELRAVARGELPGVDFDLRTATTGTAANAGNTKPVTFVAQVIEAMRERSPFLNRTRILTTGGGETMEWPVKNGRPTAAQVAENTAYGKSDGSWTKTNIGAYKYGVLLEATQEIVDDSALDILGILAQDAGEAVADKVVADLLVGDGSSKPWGWITRAAAGKTVANTAALTGDAVIDLQHSLLSPYRRNAVFMMNDSTLAVVRKLKDSTGNYLWQPSLQAGAPDMLLGTPVLTDPNVAPIGAGAKAIAYGDPSKYLTRQVKNLRVVRSDEYGFDRDVVAFKVTWRGSGDLFDTASVKTLVTTAA